MSSPRIIKLRGVGCDTPAWSPESIDYADGEGAADAFLLVSTPALDEAARERALRTLAQAEAEALARIEAAQAEADAIRAQAHHRGLDEGRSAAQDEQARLDADVRGRLHALVEEMTREREQFFSRIEPEIADLAVSIAEKVIAQEISAHPEIVVNLVRNSMKRMKERELLRVRLNPEDMDLVRRAREDLIAAVDGVQRLELIEDRRVDRGGCILESRNGNLDARIKTQVAKIKGVLSGAAHGDAADAGSVALPVAGEPDRSG